MVGLERSQGNSISQNSWNSLRGYSFRETLWEANLRKIRSVVLSQWILSLSGKAFSKLISGRDFNAEQLKRSRKRKFVGLRKRNHKGYSTIECSEWWFKNDKDSGSNFIMKNSSRPRDLQTRTWDCRFAKTHNHHGRWAKSHSYTNIHVIVLSFINNIFFHYSKILLLWNCPSV